MTRIAALLLVMAMAGVTHARDPEASKTAAARAQGELEREHPALAAALFDEAYDLDPHPLWRLAAGTAWLEALDPERARERLTAALTDDRLIEPARTRTNERLTLATKLAPIAAKARKATLEQHHQQAADLWQTAFALHPTGRIQLEVARSAQRAKLPELRALLEALTTRTDLSLEERGEVADALNRLAPPTPVTAPPKADTTTPWALLISGAALVAGGVTMVIVAADQRDDITTALRNTNNGIVTKMTRSEAKAEEATANTLHLAGLITGAAGLALTGTSIILFIDQARTPTPTAPPQTTWRVGATVAF